MRTKILLQAKKFFIETFTNGKFPSKEEVYGKIKTSTWIPNNAKILLGIYYLRDYFEQHFAKELEPFNTTSSQIEILKVLYFSSDKKLTQEEVGKYSFSSKANISSHLNKLENKKFIFRKENPKNKRQKLVVLTKEGEKFLFKIVDKVKNPHSMNNFLSKQETKEFIRLIDKVLTKFKEEKK